MNSNSYVRVDLDGKQLKSWKSVRVTAGIERLPRTFELSVLAADLSVDFSISPLQKSIEIFIVPDGVTAQLVLTGYIETMSDALSADDHEIVFSGCGCVADLVDSTTSFFQPTANNVLNNTTIFRAITLVASEFDIDVVGTAPHLNTQVRGALAINVGDTAFSVIDYLAKYVGCLVYEDENGNLDLAEVGSKTKSKTMLNHQNCIASNVTAQTQHLFSQYEMWSQPDVQHPEWFNKADAGKYTESFFDKRKNVNGNPRKRIYRKIFGVPLNQQIYPSTDTTITQQQIYANWLGRRSMGRSFQINVVVQGWTDDDGNVWQTNQLVDVMLSRQNVKKTTTKPVELLISEVEYGLSPENGTTTKLTLTYKDAYLVEPTGIATQHPEWFV